MLNKHCHWIVILGGSVACWLTGCDEAGLASADRHAEHLEHHVHHHHPASFTAAVDQIRFRHNWIMRNVSTAKQNRLDDEAHELIEILTGLPEIAGDSDLRKADWELVNQRSHQLLALYKPVDVLLDKGDRPERQSLDGADSLIGDLEKLVPVSAVRR